MFHEMTRFFKKRMHPLRTAGFTFIELMMVFMLIGILSVIAYEALINYQKGARMNDFDRAVNEAMIEITRLVTNPLSCYASFHDLGPGPAVYASTVATKADWTKVPYFIYDATKSETDASNLLSSNFPKVVPGAPSPPPAVPFRGSKVLGIRSVYITPKDYPNFPIQLNIGASRKGNAFVEINFEYIGPPDTMIGLKTRTKMLPLSVTWAKRFTVSYGSDEPEAGVYCGALAAAENCTPACSGSVTGDCDIGGALEGVQCPCAIYQADPQYWTIDTCKAVNGTH